MTPPDQPYQQKREWTTLPAFANTLDATGNRTAMDVTLNGVYNRIEYAFDDAYRLTRETRKDAAGQTLYDEGLTYDPVGNRLTRNRTQIAVVNGAPQSVTENTVYAYNAANQLVTETTNGVTTAYGYDKNGNNTTISTPAANGAPAKNIAMAYDWLNRQTKWTDGERTESTVFAGADWKRASTTVAMSANGPAATPSIVKYLYDGDNVLADYDASNALTAFYVTPGLDQNLSITDTSGATSYYTQDGLGSVRLLTSANGAILNRYDYTAFGETFAPNTVTTAPNRYTYTAREQSPLAAHGAPMYYRWRNYAPEVGRFMWRDPAVYEGSIDGNVYSYVQDRVAISSDAYGLWMSGVHTELTQIGYKQAKYAMPLFDIYLKAAVEANVATDGSGFMAKYWGSVEFAFQGFNDSEAIKHYMVGEEAIRSSMFQARRQQLLEFQQLDSFQRQELLQQYYGPNPSLPLPPFPTDHDSLGARKKAKKEAEERINEYMNLASAIWRAASKIPVKEVRMTACKQGWEYFGTALHTRQDEFSHTRGDGLPMTSIEHGWGLKYDRRGKNENRYKEALGKTTQIFKDVEKLANPYQDMCMNCITIKSFFRESI